MKPIDVKLQGALVLLTLCCLAPALGQRETDDASTPAPAAERDRFLEAMSQRLDNVDAMRMGFRQERRLAVFTDTIVTTGVCCFETPSRLRWQITEPFESILVVDGARAARFEVTDTGLERRDLSGGDALRQVLDQVAAWMRGDFEAAADAYTVELHEGETPTTSKAATSRSPRLVLRPRDKALLDMLESIELVVDPETYHVTRVILNEPLGDETVVEFLDPVENPELPPDTFDTQAPATLESVL